MNELPRIGVGIDLHRLAHPRHQPGGEERVPAAAEEVVLDPHVRQVTSEDAFARRRTADVSHANK